MLQVVAYANGMVIISRLVEKLKNGYLLLKQVRKTVEEIRKKTCCLSVKSVYGL